MRKSQINHRILSRMASTAPHVSLLFPTQTESSATPKVIPFRSRKFLSPTSRIQLNRRCASVSSLRECANSHGVHPAVVEVDLGSRSYPIYIGSGLLDKPELLQRHVNGNVLVVTNDTIAPLYLDKVVKALKRGNTNISVETLILADGEKHTDVMTYERRDPVAKVMEKAPFPEFGRRDTFVSLGGGVIGDICALSASRSMPSFDYVHIPTTVMAQVDCSVHVRRPQSVLIDTDTLSTLPDRELSSGFAEVIKYGLIRDYRFFQWLEENMPALMARDPSALAYAIKRSCEIKSEVVSSGEQAALNLGHTFGIAIQTQVVCGEWLHGEAVAAGMVMAADLSHRHGWIYDSVVQRVKAILKQANLPTAPPEDMTVDMFKSVMMMGEEVSGWLLKFALLRGPIGNCVFTGDYDRRALDATLLKFCKS